MLLEFRAKNYKTFKDELVFSMLAAPQQREISYSLLRTKTAAGVKKAVCSAVVYGPNASGKTNIIGAMDAFKSIVLRGHIRNVSDKGPNMAANRLELIPNSSNKERRPIGFAISFIEDGVLFEYEFSADVGSFGKLDAKREVLTEKLEINGKLIFSRAKELVFGDLSSSIKKFLVKDFSGNKGSAEMLARNNLNPEELFLMNGFKAMFSSKLVSLINSWLDNKFIILFKGNYMAAMPNFEKTLKPGAVLTPPNEFEGAIRQFGMSNNAFGYLYSEDNADTGWVSIIETNKAGGVIISAEDYESFGTIRFANMLLALFGAIRTGAFIAIDELDASIHPMAIMSLIKVFHNNDINKEQAQLVFNTHNPIFLSADLFRRDEIKFTDRNEETGESEHYSLSDFGTTGKNSARNRSAYMKNYFVGRYGAIRNIDFSPFFGEDEEL